MCEPVPAPESNPAPNNEKINVLIYGDEAKDIHLLIDNVASQAVLNDKLNGQSVRMVEDETGYTLICDLIKKISKNILDENGYPVSEFVNPKKLCSCLIKANFAYYTWQKRNDKNHNEALYFKKDFLGAKFDNKKTTSTQDKIDNNKPTHILIFYDRHYYSGEEDCENCSKKTCEKTYEEITNLLDIQAESPIIFIRTAQDSLDDNDNNEGEIKGSQTKTFTHNIIKKINDKDSLRNNSVVLIKLNDLKQLGAELPAKYSWEELVRSTYTELKRMRKAKPDCLVRSPLVIVDFDYDGYAAYCFSDDDEDSLSYCYLVYNKSNVNGSGFKGISTNGSVPSSTSIMQSIVANFMVRELCKSKHIPLDPSTAKSTMLSFINNMDLILKVCYLTIYYYCFTDRELTYSNTEDPVFHINEDKLCSFIKDAIDYYDIDVPSADKEKLKTRDFLSKHEPSLIKLDNKFFLPQNRDNFSHIIMKEKGYSIFDLCKEIVKEGLSKTEIPYIKFKKLISIDKTEIESYRHIFNLMLNKLDGSDTSSKPLSFCVFGNPGAGKSFGVSEILDQILDQLGKKKEQKLVFNLSQMNSISDLYNAFLKISDIILTGEIPVIFWDEFDSVYDGKQYGWLKYFLSPMEDGQYYANNTIHNVGNCIFVFAGSNSKSWSDFVDSSKLKNEENNDKDFSKITDFISRISGYIDVLGPNSNGDNTDSHKLRRAVLIRNNIEKHYEIEDNDIFIMDEDILRALIDIESYKHGTRSLFKLIGQFRANSGESRHISKYCIPNQLDLYVDKDEFENILLNTDKE